METTPTRAERLLCPALFALALGLLAWILLSSFSSAVRDPTSDDGYYLSYMQSVHANGLRVFPALFEKWNATRADWIFPPPSRVGFIVVSALWAGIFGASLTALQHLSFASHLLLCVVNYAFARRQFGEARALFLGLLLAFSALLMGLSRLALTDSFNALCMTTTVWLFLELTSRPRSFAAGVPFMAALAFMVLVKELSVLLVVPFAAFVLYERFVRRVPHDLARVALWFAVPGAVTIAVFLLAAGSPARFLETVRIVLASPATNTYAQSMGSGPWFRPILDYLLFSPVPTLLAIAWFGVTAARMRAGEYDRPSFYFALLAACLVLELSFFTKNIRYAVVLELPIRAFSVLMIGELVGRTRRVPAAAVAGLAVLLLCWLDWSTFDAFWVRGRLYDPVTALLGYLRHLVPMTVR
jgi:4-amino-4-deoxy-L-arabinose transferase-like glycosyltransferase